MTDKRLTAGGKQPRKSSTPQTKINRGRAGLTLRNVKGVKIRLDDGPFVKDGLA